MSRCMWFALALSFSACSANSQGLGTGSSTSASASTTTSTTSSPSTNSDGSTSSASSSAGSTSGGSPGTTTTGGSTTSTTSSGTTSGGLPANPTWTNYASTFVQTYCISCHQPSGEAHAVDFTTEAGVIAEADIIRCGVAVSQDPSWGCASSPVAKQFPIGNGPLPSDAERTELALWVTDGTL